MGYWAIRTGYKEMTDNRQKLDRTPKNKLAICPNKYKQTSFQIFSKFNKVQVLSLKRGSLTGQLLNYNCQKGKGGVKGIIADGTETQADTNPILDGSSKIKSFCQI